MRALSYLRPSADDGKKTEEILVSIAIVMKAINTRKAIIGIENNKRDAIEKFTQAAKAYSNIEVVALKVQYPQGGEKQLIDALLKRQVPSGALPVSVGAIVQTWVQCSPYTKLFRKTNH